MPTRTRHLQRLSPAECSDDRRARVCGPSEGRHPLDREWLIALDLECIRFVAHADAVPLLGHHRTPFVPGVSVGMGGSPYRLSTTGLGPCSNDAPRRAPPSPGPGCLSPSPVSPRRLQDDYSSPLLPASASRSRRPHFFPRLGRVLNGTLQAPRNGHPYPQCRLVIDFGSANAFFARWIARAWD
jgi:hypothetical protein